VRITKNDIALTMAKKYEISQGEARLAVDTVIKEVISHVLAFDEVYLCGLGTFKLRQYEKRAARNPKTGERVEVPARSKIIFTPSEKLRKLPLYS
jgi:DNA-binding protein HU-beta